MTETPARVSSPAITWGVAGIPILATLVQTLLAAQEQPAEAAGLGPIANVLHQVEIFRAASVVFWQRSELTISLFVLIGLAWAGQGVSMFLLRHRIATYSSATLVGVPFVVLYFLIYLPLFDRYPLRSFFLIAIPLGTSLLVYVAARTYPWDTQVISDAANRLGDLETEVMNARDSFEQEFEREIGSVSAFSSIAPNGVEQVRSERDEFLSRCDDLQAEIQELQTTSDPKTVERRVQQVATQVEALDPEGRVAAIEEELRSAVKSGVQTEYGNLSVYSRYDETYDLVNLSTEYRTVSISTLNSEVHIDNIADLLVTQLDEGVSLRKIGEALQEVESHVNTIENRLDEQESTFADNVESVEESLSAIDGGLDRLSAEVGERLSEFVRDDRHESVDGVPTIRGDLDRARSLLHECQFSEAFRVV
ncbi:MAG: hypothetical protein ABEI52_01945, partial [Halobacteriaceae archaeon]